MCGNHQHGTYHSERSKNIPIVKFRVISDFPKLFLHFTCTNFSIVIMLGILTFSFNLQLSNISHSMHEYPGHNQKSLFALDHHHPSILPPFSSSPPRASSPHRVHCLNVLPTMNWKSSLSVLFLYCEYYSALIRCWTESLQLLAAFGDTVSAFTVRTDRQSESYKGSLSIDPSLMA